MLAALVRKPVFVGCVLLVCLVSYLWSPASSSNIFRQSTVMENLSAPFTIQINGRPVAAVDTNVGDGSQAQLGSEPATFVLKDGRLVSGEWILGRNLTEDRSMMPKKISWFKDGTEAAKKLHVVTAHEDGETHRLKFGGGCLIAEEDGLFVDLFAGENCSTIQYI